MTTMLTRRRQRIPIRSPGLSVALVNNMPPAASRGTEQKFAGVLKAASQNLGVPVRLFVLETLPNRGDTIGALNEVRPDGLIVTGIEPQAGPITSEPLWPALTQLMDWAAENTISTLWSCLAAHAAVFHLDRIGRERMAHKLSGVFACHKAADHPLLANGPASWPVPHSRFNTLDESALRSRGYEVLSHAPRVGADSFAKQCGASLFLMLQGHPEYGPNSLLREFRRDVQRFVSGYYDRYPDIPEGYFDPEVTQALARLREHEGRTPRPDLLALADAAITIAPRQTWREYAVNLYANWLTFLAARKAEYEDVALAGFTPRASPPLCHWLPL